MRFHPDIQTVKYYFMVQSTKKMCSKCFLPENLNITIWRRWKPKKVKRKTEFCFEVIVFSILYRYFSILKMLFYAKIRFCAVIVAIL
jgi:hypothetical protein